MPSKLTSATIALPLMLAGAAAQAQDRYFLAGGEASSDAYYSYVGVVLPGPFRAAGQGFMQRYWLDRFGYEYDGGPGRVKAKAYGAEAALGYGISSPQGWGAVYVGARYTDTKLSPDDPGATARGSQTGVKFQIEGEHALGASWRGNLILSYTGKQDAYWTRLRLTQQVAPAWSWGVEATAAGNDESESTSAGLVVVLRPAQTWSVGLKTGYRSQSGNHGIYGGIELGYAF